MENAIIVGVELKDSKYSIDYTLDELERLAEASEINVVGRVSQKLDSINPKFYIGTGKVTEIKNMATALDATIIIFDDELSPSQLRNLEKELDLAILDRSLLILNIFAQRANTTEAILEIRLARLKYMLPRLVGANKSLSRQGGSSSLASKGSGEKQIELDRRKISNEIVLLEEKLKAIKQNRESQRTKREKTDIPIVSLVGYTNAGKSTTFNTILKYSQHKNDKVVMEKDMLFATLGTSVRNVKLPNNQQILLIDTVGFVSKLPTTLINSFRSTLEEINNSALIIHVVDSSSPHCKDQIDVTNKVLEEIGVKNSKELYLLNKADKGIDKHFFINKNHLKFSNKNGLNHDKLITLIQESVLDYSNTLLDLNIPISDGKAISIVEGYGIIEAKFISNENIYYKAYIPNNLINNLKQYYYFKTNNPKPF